jgi:hypothetical protein
MQNTSIAIGTDRRSIYLPIAALILTAAVAVLAAAQQQVPFKGTFQGNDTDSPGPTPNTVVVTTTGTGNGTHLGQFSFTEVNTVNHLNGTGTGFARLIAANGDSVDVATAGRGEPTGAPGVISITEIWTVTGGTGRFAGAQGSAKVERLASGVTFTTSGSFGGTITSPGAAH